MSLQFHLIPNHINPQSDNFMAVSTNSQRYTLDDVFDHMIQGGSTVTKADALAVFEEITHHIIKIVEEGNSVTTPLINVSSSVNGVFENKQARFNPNKHRVRINVSAGTRLAEAASEINPQKESSKERLPEPIHYIDVQADAINNVISPGGAARITGSLLKFDEEDPEQGIFFIDTGSGEETTIENSVIKNKPSELIFVNPDLPAGTYRLEVRSIVYNTTNIRKGVLPETLVVE